MTYIYEQQQLNKHTDDNIQMLHDSECVIQMYNDLAIETSDAALMVAHRHTPHRRSSQCFPVTTANDRQSVTSYWRLAVIITALARLVIVISTTYFFGFEDVFVASGSLLVDVRPRSTVARLRTWFLLVFYSFFSAMGIGRTDRLTDEQQYCPILVAGA